MSRSSFAGEWRMLRALKRVQSSGKSNAEWQLYSDFASKQRRRTAEPRSGPPRPGQGPGCVVLWVDSMLVLFSFSSLSCYGRITSCLPVTRVFVWSLLTPPCYNNAFKTIVQQCIKICSNKNFSIDFLCRWHSMWKYVFCPFADIFMLYLSL